MCRENGADKTIPPLSDAASVLTQRSMVGVERNKNMQMKQ
jgi:hypothetical protein